MKKLVLLFFLLFTNFLFSQQEEYKIMNTSVNSKYAELGVTYLNDSSIVFASSKKINTDKSFVKNRRKKNRQLFLELYRGFIDENGDIIETSSFCNEINIRIFESDISFTPDSKKMYFTWNNYYTNQSTTISPKEQTLFIFSASFDENSNITNILPLSFNSKKYSVRNPEVSKDGEKLFFSSDMENGFGEFDIYVVDIFKNGSYSSPRNLGLNINTTETELYPFIDENDVLYFSSYGHQSNGRFNIYKSDLKNGVYQKPIKLPAPINSEFDDFAFVLNNTTNSGFLTSNREDSKGGVDIYSFKIDCDQTITSLFVDDLGGKLNNVNVSLFHNANLIESNIVNGSIKFDLECNKTYKIIAEKENYISAEVELKTNNTNNLEITKKFLLTPIKRNQFITGTILENESEKMLNNVNISLFHNADLIESNIVNGSFKFDLECNKTYKIIAEKENYISAEVELKTNNTNNLEITKKFLLTPIKRDQFITGTILENESEKMLNNVNISLFHNADLIESNIVNGSFKFDLECNTTYKLVAEKENYIAAEVELKTNNTNNLEITKTFLLTPIKCNQFITGTILENESEKMLNNVNVSLFHNANLIESNIVNGTFKFDLECNTTYKIIAEKENYIFAEVELNTNNTNNFKISKTLVLTPIKCNQFITGTILENESEKMLNNVNISLFHNADLIESNIVNGSFKFDLECNTTYKLVAEKENYIAAEVELKTNNTNNLEITKKFLLTPIKCNQFITGTILENESEKMLNNVNVSLFHNADLIESNIVNGSFKFDLECNTTYKLVAEKENYTSAEVELKTNNTNNLEITKKLLLTPIKCNQFITGTILENESEKMLNNINISLFHNADLIESNIVNGSFKFDLECNTTYKLVAEKENYISAEVELNTNNTNNFKISKTLVLTPIKCNQFITGTILENESEKMVNNVNVSLFHNTDLIESNIVNGSFKFDLECNTTYKLVAEKENYISAEIELNTNNTNNLEITKTLILTPIECNQFITGEVLNKDTNLPLQNSIVTIFKENKLLDTLQLDSKARFKYNLTCNSTYKIKAIHENFREAITQIKTSTKNNFSINKTLLLQPITEFVTVREQKMINTNPIYFDLDEDEIRLDAAIELEKVIIILYKYPTIKLEIKSHTDSRAQDNYNMELSNKRAQSTINYIVSKGISPNRVTGKGYGETQLLNKCSNGVNCSEAEHQLNRRTEFIVKDE